MSKIKGFRINNENVRYQDENIAPEYSTNSTYASGNYVMHEGQLYISNAPVSTAGSWAVNSSKFTPTTIGQNTSDLKNDLDILNAGGLVLEENFIAQEINSWLNNHPEATTTVEDESLTNKKLVKGTLGFVTPEMYGAVGDGITDDYQAFVDCFNSGYVVRIPKKSYYIGTNIINSNTIVDEDHGIYTNIKPLYKKEFRIDSLKNFGVKKRVLFDDTSSSYSEGIAYNTNNNKIAVVFRIFTPEEKTKLYILNKDTFAIEQTRIYDIRIPNALDYDFDTDEYWISCYSTNTGTHRINATTLEYIGLLEVPSGYDGIYWLHDRETKTYLHSRRDDTINSYIYELFDESFNLLLTGSFEFQEENEKVHQGWKMFDGKLYQVSWYSLVEVDIVSGEVNRLITNGMREIEDICFLPDGIGYMIAHDVGGANGADWFYEFNKNEKCKNTYQDQVANVIALTDVDLNNLTADGKYYVKLTDPSLWETYHFPGGYSSGILINIAAVSNAIDIINFISFFIPDATTYSDASTDIDTYGKFIFVRYKNTNKGNMQWELIYTSANSIYKRLNDTFSYNEIVNDKNIYGSFQGGLLMIDGWIKFSGNVARGTKLITNMPKNNGANVRAFLYDETTKQVYIVVWNAGSTELVAEEVINDAANHYIDLIGLKGFCNTKSLMNN